MRAALFGALGLLLLTPFVIFPDTVSPFSVGKALWSRSLIGIAFALWAVLALARPHYRPPRSWILLLLAGGLGISLLAAATGASPQRSLWSTYSRMQGVVDQAHWVALAVVLASLLRHGREWRALLGANLAAGAALACLAIARAADVDMSFFGDGLTMTRRATPLRPNQDDGSIRASMSDAETAPSPAASRMSSTWATGSR